MVPTIGLMIGAYIIVRMFSFILTDARKESLFVKIISGLTILFTLGCMIDLMFRGTK